MMMPANYSAIAETEMTYVVGGDSLFPAFNPLSTLFTNVVNIIGNTFVPKVVNATIGEIFSGEYEFGKVFKGIGNKLNGFYGEFAGENVPEENRSVFNGVLNAGAQVLGGMAAVAQLMHNDVKAYTSNVIGINGKAV